MVKTKMEVATGVTWTESEWSKNVAGERIFFDDRPFHCDSLCWHAIVQSKAFSSYATTVMDKIQGWTDEEKWVGSKFAACMWIYTKTVLTERRKPTPEMLEYLKRRMSSIMFCVNCLCAGIFDDHEWVTESTLAEQQEAVMDLDYRICILCVVQWSYAVVFPRPRGYIKHWKAKKQRSKNTTKM